jgi:mono/diheme cytochrome c family protein
MALVVLGLAAQGGGPQPVAEAEDADKARPSQVVFEKHIAPILEARCFKCHGQSQAKAGLDLRRKFTMLKGGDNGPAISPGKPGESLLVQKIENGEMPPPEEGKLDERQRALIRQWVEAGAPLARSPEPTLEDTTAATQVSKQDREFWAFQPPKRPKVPRVRHADRVRTPIDAFLLARLEEKGLSFNPDAPRGVLLRRLSFDLLGLPPTPEQLESFLADESSDAYERLVDRLLSSPEYGVRWGRHWLDIAGYADSDGYLDADRLRPEAWRYRDYVIGALNDDLPYDRFLTEQLAGDELSDWRRASELTPEMKRQLLATGFLRTALDPTYPGYTEPNEIHQVLSDTMQIVGTAFLGMTVHCARCHAHKFDPISQRDYYSLQAVFLPALDPARWQPSEVRGIPLASDAEQTRINEHNKQIDGHIAKLSATFAELTARFRRRLVQETLAAASKTADEKVLVKLIAALEQPADKRNTEQNKLVAELAPNLSLDEKELVARYPEFAQESQTFKAQIGAEQAKKLSIVRSRGLADLDDKPPVAHVLLRGDYNKPGPTVEPTVPEVLAPAGYKLQVRPGHKTTGRRLALAQWLTDPAHPLTARVHVNRLWRHHFGRGLAPTVANFGRSGARPSHPELLDWLATEFVRLGWSQKTLHRLMVTSTAYRQSSTTEAASARLDPDNLLFGAWQPRRHEGEVLRDGALAVAGKLNHLPQGPPAPVIRQGDGSVITNDDAQGNRRSIFLIVRRSQHLTMLDLFDAPMMEVNCPERNTAIVPLQALALLHGPFGESAAAALAHRIMNAGSNDEDRLTFAYRLLLSREPRPKERALVRQALDALLSDQADKDSPSALRSAWTQVALTLLNSNEFMLVH